MSSQRSVRRPGTLLAMSGRVMLRVLDGRWRGKGSALQARRDLYVKTDVTRWKSKQRRSPQGRNQSRDGRHPHKRKERTKSKGTHNKDSPDGVLNVCQSECDSGTPLHDRRVFLCQVVLGLLAETADLGVDSFEEVGLAPLDEHVDDSCGR